MVKDEHLNEVSASYLARKVARYLEKNKESVDLIKFPSGIQRRDEKKWYNF